MHRETFIVGGFMKWSQKKTCSGCMISFNTGFNDTSIGSRCGVSIISNGNKSPIPCEPCFKPKTRRDLSEYISRLESVAKRNLEIIRSNLK